MSWILRMAWRDTRTSRRRLLLYTASITLGIAALVSIASFGESLREAVRSQSVALLGADFVARSDDPFRPEAEDFLQSLGGERADEVGFSSMVLFPRTGQSRLVSVRAIEGGFPFYGEMTTEPASAAQGFRDSPAALVEQSLMLQFDVRVGDELKLGTATFTIAGALTKVPGESPGFNLVAPRVYVPLQYLDATGLIQTGSRVNYRAYLKLPPEVDAGSIRRDNRDELREMGLRTETVDSRAAQLGRTIENLESFLGLVGYVALLLGGVGVASGIHVFIRQKLGSIAVLRCVGATVRQTFLIYLVQATVLGVIGATAGALLGIGIQALIPSVLGDLLPVDVELAVSWLAVGQGIAAGVGITLALALLPLLAVRRVSPLLALRSTIEPPRGTWHDPATLTVMAIGLAAVMGFAIQQSDDWEDGVGFVGGTVLVFGALAVMGKVLMGLARQLMPRRAPYVLRQGLANLFRPNNRTLLVVLALGLGTFLIVTMQLSQGMLLGELQISRAENRSNMVMYDIQSDQRAGVRRIVAEQGLTLIEDAPIVSMRLAEVKGRKVEEILDDRDRRTPRWVLRREYRSTFRPAINDAERIVAGRWVGEVAPGTEPVPVSVAVEIAEDLGVQVGDSLVVDVQGVPIECVVGSLREIDTRRMQPFFFIVFPVGVLEDAPQFVVMTTHVDDAVQSAGLQRAVFEAYPNVSSIDLTLVMQTVEAVLEKAGFVFRFMAAFILGTGIVVLGGVMASGRFQRLQESVLLRTIGASRTQIVRIQLVEYVLLGTLASLAGVTLAWGGAWALSQWVFELNVRPPVSPLAPAWALVSAVTVLTGWLSGRQVLRYPPLEILRREV